MEKVLLRITRPTIGFMEQLYHYVGAVQEKAISPYEPSLFIQQIVHDTPHCTLGK